MVTTEQLESGTVTFAGWIVDGDSRVWQPGEEIPVTANTQIRPKFESTTEITGYRQRTVTTEGTVRYVYAVSRTNIKVDENEKLKQSVTGEKYCNRLNWKLQANPCDGHKYGDRKDAEANVTGIALSDQRFSGCLKDKAPTDTTTNFAVNEENESFVSNKVIRDTMESFSSNPLHP